MAREGRSYARLVIGQELLVTVRLLEGQKVQCLLVSVALVTAVVDDDGEMPRAVNVLRVEDVAHAKLANGQVFCH